MAETEPLLNFVKGFLKADIPGMSRNTNITVVVYDYLVC